MAMKRTAWALTILIAATFAAADHYPRQTGIDVRHYAFRLELGDDSNVIRAEAAVDVEFREDGVAEVALDLVGRSAGGKTGMTVTSVRSGAGPLDFRHEGDRLRIALDPRPARGDRLRLAIAYSGSPADGLIIGPNKHGERAAFGDNFPDRARHWLPTVDHPSDKATCEFTVIAHEAFQVVATGALVETSSLPGRRRLTRYASSVPVPTYCMVIGVARFAVERIGHVGGVPVESWVYAEERDAGFHDFRVAQKPMEFFQWRIGPFPYEKLANVQSKTRWGGMENASAIFYHEKVVTGLRRSEGLFAHEIAHQWFGDSVTPADWDHTWLSEGFATYFTHVYNEHTKGRDELAAGLRRDRDRVVGYYERNPASAVVTPADPDLGNILSPNSYQKGGWFLHMLRRKLGDEAFWKGVSAYYARFRDGNALTADFRAVMEEVSGLALDGFFRQWVTTPGQPEIEGSWSYGKGVLTVEIRQAQAGGTLFETPVDIGIVAATGLPPRVETVEIDGRARTFTFKLDKEPAEVIIDPHVWLLMKAGEFGRKEPAGRPLPGR